MKYIDKSNMCSDFDDYITENSLDQYLNTYVEDSSITIHPWNKLGEEFEGREIKRKLAAHFFIEQKGICAYCEQSLAIVLPNTKQSDISHLEHIKPKARNRYPQETFNQKNLILSCNGFDCNYEPENPEFCGHNKNQLYNGRLFLNPTLVENIENYFEYTIEGEIFPADELSDNDRDKAEYMIDLLELKNPILVDMRKNMLSDIISYNEDEISELLDAQNDIYPSFHSMLRQLLLI